MKINTNAFLIQSTQKKEKQKYKGNIYKNCNRCNKMRKPLDKSHKICRICYQSETLYKLSGNEYVDDFIKNSQINNELIVNIMEFVPYDQFKDIRFIAKVESYEATWIEGNIQSWNKKEMNFIRKVVLKNLNNSENIISKELNEVSYILIFNILILKIL